MIQVNDIVNLVICRSDRFLPIQKLNEVYNQNFPNSLEELIENQLLNRLQDFVKEIEIESSFFSLFSQHRKFSYLPPLTHPSKIWGIGLNYMEHASDLSETSPDEIPASFMKPSTTIIGGGEDILIPVQSQKTTGEAELGIVIGKKCRNVKQSEWKSVVAGFISIIDMTAEDILRKNPRYLTLSKSFDTFISFGSQLITPDEIADVGQLEVSTVLNDKVYAKNLVKNMTFPPDFLVSFHSKIMTLLPGDVISTGTPRAVALTHGDRIECRISGFPSLINPIIDLKLN